MQAKAKAVIEVVVVFGLTLFLIALVGLSPLGAWERQVTNRAFIEYAVMIAFPLLLLVVARRDLAAYGISVRNFPYHLGIAATAFVPVALASFALGMVKYKQPSGALVMAAVWIAVLFVLGWLLKRKPTLNEDGILVGAVLLMAPGSTQTTALGNAVSGFAFYLLFVGIGEELLFRGYIQSRLNSAWGRPFQFFGVNWGWGLVIASLLFGLMHVINTGGVISGNWRPEWWWGLWTVFAGLVNGFVREKTGSIAAPAILHGLPQAIAAILGLS